MNATLTTVDASTDAETLPPPAFGPVDSTFEFPEGLLGFPDARRFVLAEGPREGLYWLQSLDNEALAFLLLDPFVFVDDYYVELGDAELEEASRVARDELAVLTIVTLPKDRKSTVTTNLQGPLLFNFRTGSARQVVLPHSPWGIRFPVELRNRARMAS